MEQDLADIRGRKPWHRHVPMKRATWQSEWLVWLVGMALAFQVGLQIFSVVGMGDAPRWFFLDVAASAGFAFLVWKLRASTGPGAAMGGLICLKLLMKMRFDIPWTQTALPPLIALFLLTFAATRMGRRRARSVETSEPEEGRGRRASQVVANLGIAGLMASSVETGILLGGLAALVEATADTVSSEVGQALKGSTISITTGRIVPPGTDGGISVAGSLCGLLASAMVATIPVMLGTIGANAGVVVFVAGCAGVLFDSLLGATLERLGWLGNDLVNFFSTVFAAGLAYEATRFFVPPQPYW